MFLDTLEQLNSGKKIFSDHKVGTSHLVNFRRLFSKQLGLNLLYEIKKPGNFINFDLKERIEETKKE